MARLIDADKLLEWIQREIIEFESEGQSALSMVRKQVEKGVFTPDQPREDI